MRMDFELAATVMLGVVACLSHGHVRAQTAEVPMHRVDDTGVLAAIGIVTIAASPDGVTLTPSLQGLPPGLHGFHIHENPSCEPALDPEKGKVTAAFAAGAHLDPGGTKRHRGPKGEGHLGDLPVLEVDGDGTATKAVLAPRLKITDLNGRALMIHAGGDSYSDEPEKLGGAGERIACGVVRVVRTTRAKSRLLALSP